MFGLVDWVRRAMRDGLPVPIIAGLVHYQFVAFIRTTMETDAPPACSRRFSCIAAATALTASSPWRSIITVIWPATIALWRFIRITITMKGGGMRT